MPAGHLPGSPQEKKGPPLMQQKKNAASGGNSLFHNILTVLGVVMCIILIPILIVNCTLIIKSYTSEEVPSVGGYLPQIVLTDSMYPVIQSGDLIICHTAEPEEVQVGDVISFFDPAGNGTTIVTHRVREITELDGQTAWRTKGDNNNSDDLMLVKAEKLVAVYQGTRIPGFGNVALFMQTTPGLILCVVLPLLLLVGYDMIRRRIYEKSSKEDTDALLKELEELRRLKAEAEQAKAAPEETPAQQTEAGTCEEAKPQDEEKPEEGNPQEEESSQAEESQEEEPQEEEPQKDAETQEEQPQEETREEEKPQEETPEAADQAEA